MGVEQTGGSRSGGIVTDVDEDEYDMRAPRRVSMKAGDHCEEVAKPRTLTPGKGWLPR
jgi:hypothetical protein